MNKNMQNKPNFSKSQIFITLPNTMSYSKKMKLDTWSKQTQTKPNLPAYSAGKSALSEAEGPIICPERSRKVESILKAGQIIVPPAVMQSLEL